MKHYLIYKFSFDSEAEREWADFLKEISNKENINKNSIIKKVITGRNNPNKNSPLEYNGYLIKDKIDREEFEQRCENEEDSRREYLALRRWDSFN